MMSDRRVNRAPTRHVVTNTSLLSLGMIYMPESALEFSHGQFDGACNIACVTAKTAVFRDMFVNYSRGSPGKRGRRVKGAGVPNPVGLETSFRPYIVDL